MLLDDVPPTALNDYSHSVIQELCADPSRHEVRIFWPSPESEGNI